MATVPNATLRYAGLWNAAVIYSWADFVVSPVNSFCYANGNANRSPAFGGSDPSVQPSNTWALMPNGGGGGGGGVTEIVAGTNVTLTPPSGVGNVTIDIEDPTFNSLIVNTTITVDTVVATNVNAIDVKTTTIDMIPLSSYNNSTLNNRLQIAATEAGLTTTTVTYTGVDGVGSPSEWVPVNTEALPLSGGTLNGWRNFKQVGTSGVATRVGWFPYNPFYGQALPFTISPNPVILKKDLTTLWAVITTQNRINVQGQIFFNIYTYNIANPPTPPLAYTNRFDYSISIYPTSWGGPTTLQTTLAGGFRYLICAVDTPKTTQQTLTQVPALTGLVSGNKYTIVVVGTTNWTAIGAAVAIIGCSFTYNGVVVTGATGQASIEVNTSLLIGNGITPNQTSEQMLHDPYDIHTDIPHIPFNTVAVASNPPQPADITDMAISAICIAASSSALGGSGVNAMPTLDWTVERIGFSASNLDINNEYILNYS